MRRLETAYHEAGHLVAKMFYRLHPIKATIENHEDTFGSVNWQNRLRPDYSPQEKMDANFTRKRLKPVFIFDETDENKQRKRRNARKIIISLLTAFAAEKKFNPTADIAVTDDDFVKAAEYAEFAYYFPKKYYKKDGILDFRRFLMDRFIPLAEKFVDEHWGEIIYAANLLYKKKTLWEKDIDELYPVLKLKNVF